MVYEAIKKRVCYGLETGLVEPEDRIYTVNQILDVLKLDEYEEPEEEFSGVNLEETLGELLDYACGTGIICLLYTSSARISWEELEKIYRNYQTIEPKLRSIGKEFVDRYFYDVEKAGIHSYRYRAKDQGHLLEKIIRKRNENFEKYENINSENFYKFITDLIGIRVFFLYREDWRQFHEYVTGIFENNPELYIRDSIRDFDDDENHFYIAEKPKVYRRTGDTRIYDDTLIDIR